MTRAKPLHPCASGFWAQILEPLIVRMSSIAKKYISQTWTYYPLFMFTSRLVVMGPSLVTHKDSYTYIFTAGMVQSKPRGLRMTFYSRNTCYTFLLAISSLRYGSLLYCILCTNAGFVAISLLHVVRVESEASPRWVMSVFESLTPGWTLCEFIL